MNDRRRVLPGLASTARGPYFREAQTAKFGPCARSAIILRMAYDEDLANRIRKVAASGRGGLLLRIDPQQQVAPDIVRVALQRGEVRSGQRLEGFRLHV